MRIVLDTNVLIDGFSDDFSAQAKLIDAVRDGEITALGTPGTQREHRKILNRLISDPAYRSRIEDFLENLENVEPARVDVVLDDEEDRKFVDAAVGGEADMLVTSDRHLLDVGEIEGVRIVTPQECWSMFEDEQGGSGQWGEFVRGMGIGK